jgi:glutamate/tyrosine decarboxylase-like PLP-dependent enzyme
MDSEERRALLMAAAKRGTAYLEGLPARPVFPEGAQIDCLRQALQTPLPDGPTAPQDLLAFLDDVGSPATVANAGGRYFGFVTGGALPASLAANWLAGAWDQNGFSFVSSPAAALFDDAALGWLKTALAIPEAAGGALVTGATMANFAGLAAARHEVLKRAGWDVERQGLFRAPEVTVIVGAEVHAAILKVLAMLGLGRERVVQVAADEQGRMRADSLPEIEGPTILCLQAGNVNSGAFDPAAEIVPLAKAKGAWVHVDGAFGLWAKAAPRLAPLAAGFEAADSWATDAHKWLNVPYDCGVAFVRDPEALHRAMSISGAYLMLGAQRDAINFTPDCSRRARGIEVWAALRALGRSGLAEMIDRNCRQARWLAEQLTLAGAAVLNEVVLNQAVVAFGSDAETKATVTALQQAGICWCGGTRWQGREAMRVSFSSWATNEADVAALLSAILDAWAASRGEDGKI